jgi:hypothetical protein
MFKPMPPYTMREDFTDKVRFIPWIGCNYESGKIFPQRILVLGESHYTKKYLNEPQINTRNYTRHIMQLWAVQKNATFYSKVRNLILRASKRSVEGYHDRKQRQNFWDSVAYYNFVQEYVGSSSRVRPKSQHWTEASDAFWEVLECLKPDVCIVLGDELWKHLPNKTEVDESTEISIRRFVVGGHVTIAANTPHPASFGLFKKNVVVPIVKKLMALDCEKQSRESKTMI